MTRMTESGGLLIVLSGTVIGDTGFMLSKVSP
jgi:hypothetical protein